MDFMTSKFNELMDFYNDCLSKADPRVADWPLMQSYSPTWILTIVYLMTVYLGMHFMKKRAAWDFPWTLFFYNSALVALNFHIFYELLTATTKIGYSYICQSVDYSDNPDEMRIASALWWYYISKVIEFMDTIFFVLRKKNAQVSFLHVYHHATMFPIWWIGVKWVPGGQSFFGAMMNAFIHVLMYTYYALAGLGPQYQRFLWWKHYLTRLQLIQFILGITHAGHSLYFGCAFPEWMQWALVFYGFSIFLLFVNFYIQAYVKPTKKRTTTCLNGNGHIANGNGAANGYVHGDNAMANGDVGKLPKNKEN